MPHRVGPPGPVRQEATSARSAPKSAFGAPGVRKSIEVDAAPRKRPPAHAELLVEERGASVGGRARRRRLVAWPLGTPPPEALRLVDARGAGRRLSAVERAIPRCEGALCARWPVVRAQPREAGDLCAARRLSGVRRVRLLRLSVPALNAGAGGSALAGARPRARAHRCTVLPPLEHARFHSPASSAPSFMFARGLSCAQSLVCPCTVIAHAARIDAAHRRARALWCLRLLVGHNVRGPGDGALTSRAASRRGARWRPVPGARSARRARRPN